MLEGYQSEKRHPDEVATPKLVTKDFALMDREAKIS